MQYFSALSNTYKEFFERKIMNAIQERTKSVIAVTTKGLIINFFLVLIKLVCGIFGRSSALIADAIHSLSDSVTDVFILIGFRFVDRPADSTHNYGHGKIETMITTLISLTVILAGLMILISGTKQVLTHYLGLISLDQPRWIALVAAFISIIMKEFLYHITKKAGKTHKSDALVVNAWHHRSDSLSSVAAVLGIGGAMLFGEKAIILDPLAAVVVSMFVLAVGVNMLMNSVMELLETSLNKETNRKIHKIIVSADGVINSHKLKTRKVGNYIAIDVHIEVNPYLNVLQAHEIASDVEKKLKKEYGDMSQISVHIEPFHNFR